MRSACRRQCRFGSLLLAKLGIVPELMTSLADDWLARMFLDMAAKYGLSVHGRKVKESSLSFVMPNHGMRAIIRCRDDHYLHPVPPLDITGCRALHLDGHQADAAMHYAKLCRDRGILTSLDGGGLRSNTLELLEYIDVAICSERLCEQLNLTPHELCNAQEQRLPDRRRSLGARGLVWYDERGNERHMPALAVPPGEVVDTNGAGDIFHGAYIFSYLSDPGKPWESHFRFARAASAHSVRYLRDREFSADTGGCACGREDVSRGGVTPRPFRALLLRFIVSRVLTGALMIFIGQTLRAAGAAILGAVHRDRRTRAGADANLRRAPALQSGAEPVLRPRKGVGDFPPQQRDRHHRDEPAEQGHASARGGEGAGAMVVPFIRPYRTRSDIQTWFDDPAIWELIQSEYKRGYYRGIGEFHIYGKAAAGAQVKRIVNFAVERDLWLHAHCDEEALLLLFGHNPKARIIWAHTGFSTPPARVRELLDKHPGLMGELSYRGGITEAAANCRPTGAPCSRAIRSVSCWAPTPGSTSAGSPTTRS